MSHFTFEAVSSWRRTDFGKMWRPNSLRVSDPECIALWNTLGFAIEMRIDWQTRELMAPVATRYGCGTPSLIAPGQNARVLLALIDRILPEEV